MGTYKEIRGTHIVSVTSDPPSPVNGQMWYNSTERVVKGFTSNPAGTWATGGSTNRARSFLTGTGIQTAALAVGGTVEPGSQIGDTESYNGTSWTELNDLNTSRAQLGSGGTYTSSLVFGGLPPGSTANTESWDGSSWTEVNNLNTSRRNLAGAGTDNEACLAFGGQTPAPSRTANTESWDGSSWTEVNNLNAAKSAMGSTGTETAALAFGGNVPSISGQTESWNGTSWTEVNDLNTSRNLVAGAGTYTSALAFGGNTPPNTAKTELWNGTSWSEQNDLSTARDGLGGAGADNTSALAFCGADSDTTKTAVSEEWTAPTTSTVTFTVS